MREVVILRIPKVLKDNLKEEAKNKGYSLNALILKRLWEHKEKREW